MAIERIECLTKEYGEAREALGSAVDSLQRELAAIKARSIGRVKRLVAKAAEAEARLRAEIEAHPEDFARPKTQVFHGIRVGYMKRKGSIAWEDADAVVRLIFKHFAERADSLTRTTVVPNRAALSEMAAADLKKLGVTVEETGDAVVVKPLEGEVERIVNALLRDALEETEAA